jgi:hypothetical protein
MPSAGQGINDLTSDFLSVRSSGARAILTDLSAAEAYSYVIDQDPSLAWNPVR